MKILKINFYNDITPVLYYQSLHSIVQAVKAPEKKCLEAGSAKVPRVSEGNEFQRKALIPLAKK